MTTDNQTMDTFNIWQLLGNLAVLVGLALFPYVTYIIYLLL